MTILNTKFHLKEATKEELVRDILNNKLATHLTFLLVTKLQQ
jgi:hypothetical protein